VGRVETLSSYPAIAGGEALAPDVPAGPPPRNVALDGLRGILTVVVLLVHIGSAYLSPAVLYWPGRIPVLIFFVLSSYVLTRIWHLQSFAVFLAKRFVRLWPVFAMCVIAGAWSSGVALQPGWFIWVPFMVPVDMPSWSLGIEARAMLVMPIIVWSGRGSLSRSLGAGMLCYAVFGPSSYFGFCAAFLIGTRLSRREFRCGFLEWRGLQWLGKISYSLYISQWIVVAWLYNHWGIGGSIITVPVAILVAWVLWRLVERPSIVLSRRVGRAGSFGWPGVRTDQAFLT
jgi:peptidoglycan/LPS O-acetylase OafA/YrhL